MVIPLHVMTAEQCPSKGGNIERAIRGAGVPSMTEGSATAPAQSLLSRLLRLYLTIEAGSPQKWERHRHSARVAGGDVGAPACESGAASPSSSLTKHVHTTIHQKPPPTRTSMVVCVCTESARLAFSHSRRTRWSARLSVETSTLCWRLNCEMT